MDKQVAKQEEIQAQTEEDAMVHQIESQLASSGLPVVSDNVSLVMDAYGLALESQNISRSGMNFLIGTKLSSHTGTDAEESVHRQSGSGDTWERDMSRYRSR